ncbi:alginate lyase family protein [Actinocorallia sp. B10E7]|uniref:alginate lyase family protein n=1 Tax=Actinocorallia sp. B10E7 TaxID=3153558 RepID=UPI00325CA88D
MSKKSLVVLVACVLATGLLVAPQGQAGAAPKFKHPGVLVTRAQLDYVRAHLKRKPFKGAFAALKKNPLASLKAKPHPWTQSICEPYGVGSNGGCSAELHDANAAYATALLWYLTKDRRYLAKTAQYMNSWSRTLKERGGADAPLQAGWAAISWTRAAEIARYSLPKKVRWKTEKRFEDMLRKYYLPWTVNGYHDRVMNGNWELALADATVDMGVFLDDRRVFDRGIEVMRSRVPAYFYLKSDGPRPHQPTPAVWDLDAYWYQPCSETISPEEPEDVRHPCAEGQHVHYVNGQTQETCRDRLHATYGIAAVMQLAETAKIQGRNLFPELRARITAASELTSRLNLAGVPADLCGGAISTATGAPASAFEIVWQEYHKKTNLPWTKRMVLKQRPGTVREFIAWETLTNARA